jgi:hypothetical protein
MRRWSTVVLLVLLLAAGSVNGVADDTPLPVTFLPLAGWSYRVIPPPLLISALYYDTFQTNEPDEAFQLYNPLDEAVGLESWQVTDGTRTQTFPRDISLAGHGKLWCAKRGTSFQLAFGFLPGCEYGGDTDPTVPDLPGSALRFANTGGQVTLIAPTGAPQDTLVYEGGDTSAAGWQGPAVYPYKPSTAFGEEGQILYRKLDQSTGWPVADTDTRADWAQETEDIINGRKAQLPGWDLERFFVPQVVTETAGLEVFVAPDHAFTEMRRLLEGTQQSIRFEGYTFESARLGEVIAGRARAGVAVEMTLEGNPPGGVSDQQRWVVQQIAAVMDADIAPGAHRDVWTWDPADPTLGAPPAGFTPSYASGGIFYPVQKPSPLQITGTLTFQLIHSPDATPPARGFTTKWCWRRSAGRAGLSSAA